MFSYSVVTDIKCIKVDPGGILPIPLSYVMSYLWVRPIDQSQPPGHGYMFCNKPITWSHVSRPGETVEEQRMCISSRNQCYRLVLKLFCNNFHHICYVRLNVVVWRETHVLYLGSLMFKLWSRDWLT